MGVLKTYGGVEVHIHFILKSALHGFQWLVSRGDRFNAADAGWARSTRFEDGENILSPPRIELRETACSAKGM